MLTTLRFPKPPPNITVQQLFHKLTPTAQNAVQKAGKELLGNPLFSGVLSDKQWHMLEDIQKDLNNEYTIRREMLLKRLDCTIQSFEVKNSIHKFGKVSIGFFFVKKSSNKTRIFCVILVHVSKTNCTYFCLKNIKYKNSTLYQENMET